MNEIIYISNIDVNNSISGVTNKIKSQISVLNSNDFITVVPLLNRNKYIFKFFSRLPFISSETNITMKKFLLSQDLNSVVAIYIRRSLIDNKFINNLKYIKNKKPKISIILEISSYPYLEEMRRITQFPYKIKELIGLKKISNFVDRIVTYTEHKYLFGVPCINLINGIDYKNSCKIHPIQNSTNEMRIIAVAQLDFWHGYDRVINGIYDYYKTKKSGMLDVFFDIVGNGPEKSKLLKQVEDLNLQEFVIFHGLKFGESLDAIYNTANIAVETLGMHRKNAELSSSLKSREYILKGLPFISSAKIDVIPDNWKYFYKVSSDESSICIKSVIDFVNGLNKSNQHRDDIINEIHSYGSDKFDIKITFKPVIEYLDSLSHNEEKFKHEIE